MANHITSVIEIREAGILLAARGTHVIRVLGALKVSPIPSVAIAKEDLTTRVSASVYDSYYSGSLSGPQQDPSQASYNPRVPSFFVTRTGETLFLQRDPSGEVPPDDSSAPQANQQP
jgi:hypothetical protein